MLVVYLCANKIAKLKENKVQARIILLCFWRIFSSNDPLIPFSDFKRKHDKLYQ